MLNHISMGVKKMECRGEWITKGIQRPACIFILRHLPVRHTSVSIWVWKLLSLIAPLPKPCLTFSNCALALNAVLCYNHIFLWTLGWLWSGNTNSNVLVHMQQLNVLLFCLKPVIKIKEGWLVKTLFARFILLLHDINSTKGKMFWTWHQHRYSHNNSDSGSWSQ